jgi:hypothetical protein
VFFFFFFSCRFVLLSFLSFTLFFPREAAWPGKKEMKFKSKQKKRSHLHEKNKNKKEKKRKEE